MAKVGAHLEFGVLGDLTVTFAGHAIEIGSRKQRALLAVLLCNRGRTVSAPILIDALWGERPPPSALPTLRTLANRLRQVLAAGGEPPLLGRDGGYLLDVDAHQIDAERFMGLVQAARVARGVDLAQSAEHLHCALALWRGPAFGDLAEAEVLRLEADHLEKARLGGIEELAELHLGLGRTEVAVEVLTPHVAAHPLRERAAGALMLALYREGRQAEALTVYQKLQRVLDAELGVEPTPAVRELHGRILRHDRELGGAQAQLARDTTSFVGRNGELAAIQALLAGSRTVLPAALTPFVGRAEEVTAVAIALGRSRLVTLIGPGGAGKTRLAIHTAQTVHEAYPEGVWFVDLTALRDPDLVPAQIAAAVGLDVAALLAGGKPLLDSLCDQLRNRQSLLVLDNCEHLVGAAAKVAGDLLARASRVGILATSREVLAVPGEVVVRVGGMSLPPAAPAGAAELRGSDAVALFCVRATASGADFTLTDANAAAVANICRRLDGLPLALELAAARTRMLGVLRLADRVATMALAADQRRAADPRHRTLATAIEWSHDLLTPDERIVLRRLSVFPAPWTLDAAEAVAAGADALTGPEGEDVFDLLARLVDKSLVLAMPDDGDEPRYRLLETIRQYAGARLAEHDETDPVRARHREFWRGLGRQWLTRDTSATWMRRVDRDLDNIRDVLVWSAEGGDEQAICEIVAPLAWHWTTSSPPDAVPWFRRAVAAPTAGIEAAAAHARLGLAQLLQATSDSSTADRLAQFRDALEFATAANVPTARAWARAGVSELFLLGGRPDESDPEVEPDTGGAPPVYHASATFLASVRALPYLGSGELDRAQQILGDLATHADRHHRDEYVRVHVLALLAVAEAARGDADAAEVNAQAAVLGARAFPSPLATAMALIRAVEAALLSGRVARARALLPEALLLLRDLGAHAWVGEALESTAAALAVADPATAAACLGAAAEVRAQRGEHGFLTPALRDLVEGTESQVLAALGPEADRVARRHGSGLERAEMLARARAAVLHLVQWPPQASPSVVPPRPHHPRAEDVSRPPI